jgi:hypothetical protein
MVTSIDDLTPAVLLEIANGGLQGRGGRAWLERAVDLKELVELGPRVPVERKYAQPR